MPEFDPENLISTKDTLNDNLVRYRDLYSNRIPNEILHSNVPDNRFKVRKTWFVGVFQCIDFYTDRRDAELGPALLKEYEELREEIGKNLRTPTTASDVNRTNRLINRIIGAPEETGVPYDRILAATDHVLRNGDSLLRWHGVSQDEIASRLPNYHYSHVYDIQQQHSRYTPPSDAHDGWVIAGYSSVYQGEEEQVSPAEKSIEVEIKIRAEEWRGTDSNKRLLVLAQTLPSPYVFTNAGFPWQHNPLSSSIWTVAFDGQSQVTLTKHRLEKSPSSDERKWVSQGVLHF